MKDDLTVAIEVTVPATTKLYLILYAIASHMATREDNPFDMVSLLEETGHADLTICPACSIRNFQHQGGCIYGK
jgi:hypothetical protein